jgi:hypothetical protein
MDLCLETPAIVAFLATKAAREVVVGTHLQNKRKGIEKERILP